MMIFCRAIVLFALSCLIFKATAQTSTDIYLVDINLQDYNLNYENLKNITDREGYDNQPHFSADGNHLLFSSIRSNKQSDIYKYDIITEEITQITNTEEASEYSPTYYNNGKYISVVQQDWDKTQHLMSIEVKSNKKKIMLSRETQIGYHVWLSKKDVALFIVGEPHKLAKAKKRGKKATVIDEKIGAALQKVPGKKAVAYQFFEDSTQCQIKEFQIRRRAAKPVCECLEDAVSFIYLKDGNIVSGIGNKLYLFDKKRAAKGWTLIADFSDIEDFDFYRIAINQQETQMALVVNRKK